MIDESAKLLVTELEQLDFTHIIDELSFCRHCIKKHACPQNKELIKSETYCRESDYTSEYSNKHGYLLKQESIEFKSPKRHLSCEIIIAQHPDGYVWGSYAHLIDQGHGFPPGIDDEVHADKETATFYAIQDLLKRYENNTAAKWIVKHCKDYLKNLKSHQQKENDD